MHTAFDADLHSLFETLLRLGFATLAGALVGINRDLHGKPIGLRTLGIVALGSATVTLLIAAYAQTKNAASVDAASRVIQGILTGIGFLGAGVILHPAGNSKVQGLTTAASIWVTAGIGAAAGLGCWDIAIAATVLTLLLLSLGSRVEKLIERVFGRDDA